MARTPPSDLRSAGDPASSDPDPSDQEEQDQPPDDDAEESTASSGGSLGQNALEQLRDARSGGGGTDDTQSEPDRSSSDPFQGAETDTSTEPVAGIGGGGDSDQQQADGSNQEPSPPDDPFQVPSGSAPTPNDGAGDEGDPTPPNDPSPPDDAFRAPDGDTAAVDEVFDRDDPTRDGSTAREQAVDNAPGPADPSQPDDELGEREREAIQQFVESSDTFDREDIAGATRSEEEGVWEIQLSEEGRTAYIRENTDRASQSVSLGTTGTPQFLDQRDTARASQSVSLGTTGGFGVSDTRRGRIEDRTPRANQSVSLSTTGGFGMSEPVVSPTDRIENEIEARLEEAGVDPENVDFDAKVEDGEVRLTDDLNDNPVRIPSGDDTATSLGAAFDAATDPIFEPLGVDGKAVADAATDEFAGRRVEDVLGELSDDYQEFVADNRETGGEITQQAVADMVLGPFASGPVADDAADLAIAAADQEAEDFDVDGFVEARSEDVFEGAASVGNIPALAATAKESAEFADFAIEETAEGDSDVVVEEATDRALVSGAQVSLAATKNPAKFTSQLAGSLAAGAATGYGTSAALGGTIRSTLRGVRSVGDTPSAFARGYRQGKNVPFDTAALRAGRRTQELLDDDRAQLNLGQLSRSTDTDSSKTITRSDLENFDSTDGDPRGNPEWVPGRSYGSGRDRDRAGLDEQGSFRGTNTYQQDPAFGGSGKPNVDADRDFSAVREQIGANQIAKAEPEVDLRDAAEVPSAGTSTATSGSGLGVLATRVTGAGVGASLLSEIAVGEGTTTATQPSTFAGAATGTGEAIDDLLGTTPGTADAAAGIPGLRDDATPGLDEDDDLGIGPTEDTDTFEDLDVGVATDTDLDTRPETIQVIPGTGAPSNDSSPPGGGGGDDDDGGRPRPFLRFPNLDDEDNEDESGFLGEFTSGSDVFDTGVVQSIDEATGSGSNSGNSGNGDPWDFDGF